MPIRSSSSTCRPTRPSTIQTNSSTTTSSRRWRAVARHTTAFSFWLYWPRWQVDRLRSTMPDTKARADVEDNFRKTAGQAIGGFTILIGAGFAYLQFQQQQQAARDLLISNQVSKGFEQLGSKEIETRLGGIYVLEGVMNTSKQYHKPVLEALSAFVRDHTKAETAETRD